MAPIESGSTITIPPATSIAFEASLLYGVARNRDINISLDLDDPVTVKGTVVSISVITLPLGLTGSLNSTVSNDYVEGNTCKLTALNEAQAVDWYCYAFFVKQFKKLFDSQTTNLSYCALRVIKYPSSPTALSNWDKMVEPKLLSYPFTSFNFVDYHKQYSDYNLYKIFSDSNVQYLYHYNVFGAGVFQDFLCFSRTHPYYGYNKKYGIGEVTNYGDTLGFGTDSYAEWCRNNSTSAQTNLALGVVGGAVSVIGGALMTAVNPVVGGAGVVGGATSIATSIAKYEANKSDIANARETFSQPSANILFSESFNINLPYGYQIKTIGEEDRNLVSSYFYYNGYAYNSTEKFLTAIGTRCMFNYIQSSDALIKASIKESEDIKNKVLEILSKGCEIWSLSFLTGNSKTITESRGIYANYEKDIL